MNNLSQLDLLTILRPLGFPEGRIAVEGIFLDISVSADRDQDLFQRERARLWLIQSGWEVERIGTSRLVVTGPQADPEFVKFMQAKPDSDAFEGLARFNTDRLLQAV